MTQIEIQTKDRIMQVAFGLFLTQGYETTPVQAIIDAVGIAKGTFYHHFRSKEEMLIALVDSITRAALDNAAAIMQRSDLNAVAKLETIFRQSTAIKFERMDESMILIRQMRTDSNQRLLQHVMNATLREVSPLIAQLIRQGTADGSFNVKHPDETAKMLMMVPMGGSLDDTIDLWIAAMDGKDPEMAGIRRLLEACESAMSRLLGCPDGSVHLYDIDEVITNMQMWRKAQ